MIYHRPQSYIVPPGLSITLNTTPTYLPTNIQNRHRRIMVRRLRIILHPRIQMQMLHPRLRLCKTLTHIHMVQLLTVHVI